MKVTVCFGDVRVLVPCGQGDLLVRDLVREATLRYRKATGKGSESWVVVRNLRSGTGGILDPDDRLKDVADDRETLVATLEGRPDGPLHQGGDGASGSSVGTASPDLFRVGCSVGVGSADNCGVEVGVGELGSGGLQVRRGSEPTLNQDNLPTNQPPQMTSERWSAAVVMRDANSPHLIPPLPLPGENSPQDQSHISPLNTSYDSSKLNPGNGHTFQRQSNRLSMQFSGPGSGAWVDAAERIQVCNTKSLPRDSARKEPLGQDTSVVNSQNHRVEDMLRWVSGVNSTIQPAHAQERPLDRLPELPMIPSTPDGSTSGVEVGIGSAPVQAQKGGQLTTVALVKGEKGLGFTITTRDNPTGGVCPIYVKNILPKGAAVTDGRLRAGDRMVSVNGVAVSGLSQQQVVSLLRSTPTHSTVTIVVERPHTATIQTVSNVGRTQRVEPQVANNMKLKDPNLMNNHQTTTPYVVDSIRKDVTDSGRVNSLVQAFNQNNNNSMRGGSVKKSSSKDDLINHEQMNKSDQSLQDALNSSNTVLGLRHRSVMRLDIPVHDSEKAGLGISVKGKVTVGNNPQDLGIFVKSVLHGGAASRDGRLHTNDQLLNINGVSLVGQSNAEAMETLRRALVHTRSNVQGNISLTIARRTESMDSIAGWKDDTPPNVNELSNSNENILSNSHSRSFSSSQNTVIYKKPSSPLKSNESSSLTSRDSKPHKSVVSLDSNYNKSPLQYDTNLNKLENSQVSNHSNNSKKHSSIVNINNNNTSWISNQSDENRNFYERDGQMRDTKDHSKRDSFEWGRLDGWNPVIDRLTGLRNESYCMATQNDVSMNDSRDQPFRSLHHQPVGLRHNIRSPPHNIIIEEEYGTKNGPGGTWESGSESGCGTDVGAFSRDAIGRRSMSEKRHAAMDAKNTDTYKKIKELKANNVPVGPSLGMRKSSSLESLQTAIQEVSMHRNMGKNDPIYGRGNQPLKHWLTDNGVDGIVRGTPAQSSLHSHKKPSLLKSISTMLRFGKQRPKIPDTKCEIYTGITHRGHPVRASEKSIAKSDITERIHDSSSKSNEVTYGNSNGPLSNHHHMKSNDHHNMNGSHTRQSSVDRLVDGNHNTGASGREERNQMNVVQNSGHGARNSQWAPPYRHPPARTGPGSHPVSQVIEGPWGGGHYVNYEEIQQNLNARKERLSEVQIGQMRRQVHAQRIKAEEERRGMTANYHSQRSNRSEVHRPQSNFYEYESIQHARPINAKVTPYN